MRQARAQAFAKQADDIWTRGKAITDPMPVKAMITYHRSWSYLGNAFGLEIAGEAEPVPGIPPTARHLAELIDVVKQRHIPLFLREPYFSKDAADFLAREGGVRVVVMSPSCDTVDAGSYLAHFDQILNALAGGKTGS